MGNGSTGWFDARDAGSAWPARRGGASRTAKADAASPAAASAMARDSRGRAAPARLSRRGAVQDVGDLPNLFAFSVCLAAGRRVLAVVLEVDAGDRSQGHGAGVDTLELVEGVEVIVGVDVQCEPRQQVQV